MKNYLTDYNTKIKVTFFHRRPHKGINFSIESIFEDVRNRLKDKIEAKTFSAKCYNKGYFTKFINILYAAIYQGRYVNHITGEVHFLNLLMNRKKVVLTIHDCGMVIRKRGIEKKIVKWLYLSAPISKARFVTTVSEVTKKEIIAYTKCKPDKIKVIPVAVDPIYLPYPKEFNQDKPTILHIGTGYNKNLLRLTQALNGINCHLIIVGKLSQEYINALVSNNIDFSNEYNISKERLLEKYKECDLLAFVSTFEGFGMPIVEANSVERVVITGNLSSMPEIAGKAACLVNPFNVEEVRCNIKKIIEDKTYRDKLILAGRKNKLRFDGERIAAQYYNLYSQVT